MQLASFVDEVACWIAEVERGNARGAERRLEQLYRAGAALVASREFQSLAMEQWRHPLDQQVLENVRLFFGLVQAASVREQQRQQLVSAPVARAA